MVEELTECANVVPTGTKRWEIVTGLSVAAERKRRVTGSGLTDYQSDTKKEVTVDKFFNKRKNVENADGRYYDRVK